MPSAKARKADQCKHNWKEVNQKLSDGRIQLNLVCRTCRCTIVEIYTIIKKYIIDRKGKFIHTVDYNNLVEHRRRLSK